MDNGKSVTDSPQNFYLHSTWSLLILINFMDKQFQSMIPLFPICNLEKIVLPQKMFKTTLRKFCSQIRKSKIREIIFSGYLDTEEQLQILAKGVRKLELLKVRVGGPELNFKGITILLETNSFCHLWLQCSIITKEIVNAIYKQQNVVKLELDTCWIETNALTSDIIKGWELLSFRDCNFPVYETIEILDSCNLRQLRLETVGLCDENLQRLAEILPSCVYLTELYLGNNKITEIGMYSLCSTLHLTNLSVLDLQNNQIADFSSLCISLHCSSLKLLCLDRNQPKSPTWLPEILASIKGSQLRLFYFRGMSYASKQKQDILQCLRSSCLDDIQYDCQNLEYLQYDESIAETICIILTRWFKTIITLLSPKTISRLGTRSQLRKLPVELIRAVASRLPCNIDYEAQADMAKIYNFLSISNVHSRG